MRLHHLSIRQSLCLFTLVLTCTFDIQAQSLSLLHASGTNIVDASGTTVQLKGVNLGGWFIMENYMTPIDSSGTYTDMYSMMTELNSRFGVTTQQSLLTTYQQSWVTAADLDNIQAAGLNVVRIPIWWGMFFPLSSQTSSTFRSDSFTVLDSIINACASRGIYVILDMHGTLGAQSGSEDTGHTHDGGSSTGIYFSNTTDQAMTLWLWEQIASHYSASNFANYATIAAFDLLNEPTGGTTAQVVAQYNSLYSGIRSVDSTRMLIMETISSSSWSWNTLPAPSANSWTNVVYSTHMYACSSTPASCTASQVATQTTSTVSGYNSIISSGYDVPGYVGEYTAYNTGTTQWASTQTAFANAGLSHTAWAYKANTRSAYDFWGWYCPGSSRPTTPNIASDSSTTIANDWSDWTTAAYFTVNSNINM